MTTQTLPAVRQETLPSPVERDAAAALVMERVIIAGDLSRLTPLERVAYYLRTCESLGLNPLTKPFEYLSLNGKLILYVRKDATDQLRSIHRVSIDGLRRDLDTDLGLLTYIADGHTPDGRRDQASGTVSVKGLSGEALANASMKAETKSKRRLTLSLVGLGFLDESEIEGGDQVDVDPETGEIRQAARPASLLDAVQAQRARLDSASPNSAAATTSSPHVDGGGEGEEVSPAAAEQPDTVEGEVVSETPAPATCGWKLGRGSGKAALDCTLGEMHAGKHSWDEVAIREGGKVIRPAD